jgi:hypothetical protein
MHQKRRSYGAGGASSIKRRGQVRLTPEATWVRCTEIEPHVSELVHINHGPQNLGFGHAKELSERPRQIYLVQGGCCVGRAAQKSSDDGRRHRRKQGGSPNNQRGRAFARERVHACLSDQTAHFAGDRLLARTACWVYALVLCGLHHRYMRMSGRTGSVMEEAGDCRPLASSRLQLILALDWNRKPISLQHLYIANAGFPRNS